MNHDDHKPDLSTLIDPELEARIVAWVSGEASPFEAAELTRLTTEKPELAVFKRRIEAVRAASLPKRSAPDPEPLSLSPDRRAKLLQGIGAAGKQKQHRLLQPVPPHVADGDREEKIPEGSALALRDSPRA